MKQIDIQIKVHSVIKTGAFMPSIRTTTPFGTDCTTQDYFNPFRLHIAKDRGRGAIYAPFSCWTRFYDIQKKSTYGTITQLISDGTDIPLGYSLVIMHCNVAPKKDHYFINELVTHTGNVGLGTGEHAHYEVWYTKDVQSFENHMTEAFASQYNNNDKLHFAQHTGLTINHNSSNNDTWYMYARAENADLTVSKTEIYNKYISELEKRGIVCYNDICAIVYEKHIYNRNIIKINPEIMGL